MIVDFYTFEAADEGKTMRCTFTVLAENKESAWVLAAVKATKFNFVTRHLDFLDNHSLSDNLRSALVK